MSHLLRSDKPLDWLSCSFSRKMPEKTGIMDSTKSLKGKFLPCTLSKHKCVLIIGAELDGYS